MGTGQEWEVLSLSEPGILSEDGLGLSLFPPPPNYAFFYAEELFRYSDAAPRHGEQVHCLPATGIPCPLRVPHLLQWPQLPPLFCKALAVPAALFQGLAQGVHLLLGRERGGGGGVGRGA